MKPQPLRRRLILLCLSACFLPFSGCHPAAPAPAPAALPPATTLVSPWDATPVAPTDAAYPCAPAPAVGPDLTVTAEIEADKQQLSDEVKSAVYSESSSALHDLTRDVIDAADSYRATGNIHAAACVASELTEVARHGGLTGYVKTSAGWEQHSLALRTWSISWLKVRGSGAITPAQQAAVLPWLDRLSRDERSYYEHRHCGEDTCDLHGHRGHSAASAAAAVGVAANDPGQFRWAVSEYHSAVGRLTQNGHIHYDMKGRYALLFNLESAANLVQIAELGEVNHDPLYGYDHGRLHELVHNVAMGLIDPAPFKLHTSNHAAQKHYTPIQPWEIAWASVYDRRFPDPVVTGLLRQVGTENADRWGGEPWDPLGDPETE